MQFKGFLIDIDGVLLSGGRPVTGAVGALKTLEEKGYPFRCVSNTTRRSGETIADQMKAWGFPIRTSQIFTPPNAAIAHILRSGRRRCHLVSTGAIDREFDAAGIILADESVDFVVVGDAGDRFTYPVLNHAFRLVLDGAELLALERDRYWMGTSGLMLGAGPFVAAIEYAAGREALVMGKPSPHFFAMALADMGLAPEDVAMIGDDIITDVGGAQQCGMRGIQVKTGKFRPEVLETSHVSPDFVIDSVADIAGFL